MGEFCRETVEAPKPGGKSMREEPRGLQGGQRVYGLSSFAFDSACLLVCFTIVELSFFFSVLLRSFFSLFFCLSFFLFLEILLVLGSAETG